MHENSLDGKISEKLQLTGPCTLAGGFFPTGRLENRSISWSFMVRPRTMHSLLGKPNIPCQDLESTLGAEKTDQANREPRHRQSKLQDSGCSLHVFSNFLHPLQGESSGKRCKVVFFSDPACRSCPVFVIFLVPVCHFWPWSVRTRTEMYTCNIYIYLCRYTLH